MAITWDVAGTEAAPFNTQNVQVLLTRDGGATFEVLAESVPNTGSANVDLPNENIATARIMIKAVDNIYFAVNSSNFKVKQGVLATLDGKLKGLSIYPNPAKNEVNVILNKADATKYMIYDLLGRMVSSGNVAADGRINVERLATGNYVLSIQLKNGEKVTEKLMIKK